MASAFSFGFFFFLVLCINNSSFCNGSSNSNMSCIESEREALLKFKKDLHDPSNRLGSWDDAADCCKWSGIICDSITGHIHKLLLRGPPNPLNFEADDEIDDQAISFNELHAFKRALLGGKVNPSLVELKHLRHLDLSNNDFGATPIPKFFGSLRSLRYLNLSYAKFSGVIPHQLGNLTHLRVLDLHLFDVTLGGFAKNLQWLSHLSSLRFLDMSYVDLSQASDWLEVTNSLPSLTVLHLSSCLLNFNVPLPYHVNFSSLAVLDLSLNYFYGGSRSPIRQGIPEWISNLRSLASLDLRQAANGSPIPEGIQNLTSLVHLDLSYNYFSNTSSIPSWLYKMSGLNFLHLGYNYLGGTISSRITNLTSIIMLDLSYNHFEGKLPTSMGSQLCNLKQIYLPFNEWNQSISQILDSLHGCVSSNLEVLDIMDGQIYGQLTDQIGQFKSLTKLALTFNMISGPIPVSLGNLLSLRYLSLGHNHFNGTLPEPFGQLAKLEYLDIYGNEYMEGVVSEAHFANSTRLRQLEAGRTPLTLDVRPSWLPPFQLVSLDMESWHLGPSFPLWLRSQENLSVLILSNTSLEDVIPSWFWDSFVFSYLDLSHNQMHGRIKKLSVDSGIDLRHNGFEGPLPSISSNVATLYLSNNMFSGSISQFLCNRPSEQMNLVILHLQNNQLSGAISNCWSTKWKNLMILKLSDNKFNSTIPSSLGSLVLLQSLHLRNNNLSGELPLSLRNCTELITLDLGGNMLRGRLPAWIGTRLLNLQILSLRSNKFQGRIPEQLCALSALQLLDVAHNNLSGFIPKCVYNFSSMVGGDDYRAFWYKANGTITSFEEDALLVMKGQEMEYIENLVYVNSIDLSGNFLSGEIPTEITSLAKLVSLNLSNNLLTGEIPHGMGKMGALESVDFSVNKLSGEIPPSMSNLSFLSHLNLSYNKLRGRIPLGTQLQSFEASSYIWNSLCGPPLTQNCSGDDLNPTAENKTSNGDEDNDDNELSWFYLGMGMGFAIGFWGVCGCIFFNRRWRHNYFWFLDRMKDNIYVASSLKVRWLKEKLGDCFHNA
ncbi:receptor-like protein EIX2 [Ziziphus jujuba]|uniref:Receptor-like protein EIX2 n=1 Tax=Ziziphus jujuba TaxID=326968 RepID=A0ABM3IDQ6_ZIZJJ|nr:receptor-like protein EIX2 [Ziziphus jujuba]